MNDKRGQERKDPAASEIRNHMIKLYQSSCACYPWSGRYSVTVWQLSDNVMYYRLNDVIFVHDETGKGDATIERLLKAIHLGAACISHRGVSSSSD